MGHAPLSTDLLALRWAQNGFFWHPAATRGNFFEEVDERRPWRQTAQTRPLIALAVIRQKGPEQPDLSIGVAGQDLGCARVLQSGQIDFVSEPHFGSAVYHVFSWNALKRLRQYEPNGLGICVGYRAGVTIAHCLLDGWTLRYGHR